MYTYILDYRAFVLPLFPFTSRWKKPDLETNGTRPSGRINATICREVACPTLECRRRSGWPNRIGCSFEESCQAVADRFCNRDWCDRWFEELTGTRVASLHASLVSARLCKRCSGCFLREEERLLSTLGLAARFLRVLLSVKLFLRLHLTTRSSQNYLALYCLYFLLSRQLFPSFHSPRNEHIRKHCINAEILNAS